MSFEGPGFVAFTTNVTGIQVAWLGLDHHLPSMRWFRRIAAAEMGPLAAHLGYAQANAPSTAYLKGRRFPNLEILELKTAPGADLDMLRQIRSARFRAACREAREEPLANVVDRVAETLGAGTSPRLQSFHEPNTGRTGGFSLFSVSYPQARRSFYLFFNYLYVVWVGVLTVDNCPESHKACGNKRFTALWPLRGSRHTESPTRARKGR